MAGEWNQGEVKNCVASVADKAARHRTCFGTLPLTRSSCVLQDRAQQHAQDRADVIVPEVCPSARVTMGAASIVQSPATSQSSYGSSEASMSPSAQPHALRRGSVIASVFSQRQTGGAIELTLQRGGVWLRKCHRETSRSRISSFSNKFRHNLFPRCLPQIHQAKGAWQTSEEGAGETVWRFLSWFTSLRMCFSM